MTDAVRDPGLSANFRYTTSTDMTGVGAPTRCALITTPSYDEQTARRPQRCRSDAAPPTARASHG